MPIFDKITTKSSKKVWESDNGQIQIFELEVDYQGNTLPAKTYSKQISTVGWSGQVETYEKEGKNGTETFVKQPAKENSYGGKSGYQPRDDSHIKAQWAIGQAVTLINDPAKLGDIQTLAADLFRMVDVVRYSGKEELDDVVSGDELDEAMEDLDQGQMSWPKS